MTDLKPALERYRPPTSIKLALLWSSLMFLYIYNDYFIMFTPGTIAAMSAGKMGPLGKASEVVMVATSLLLAFPALMIFLSAALPSMASRWLNVILGAAYTAVEVLTFGGPHPFYRIVVGIELALTLLIVWYALRWPRVA
jgi:hypothetical protein